jgi:hypothetical protein
MIHDGKEGWLVDVSLNLTLRNQNTIYYGLLNDHKSNHILQDILGFY